MSNAINDRQFKYHREVARLAQAGTSFLRQHPPRDGGDELPRVSQEELNQVQAMVEAAAALRIEQASGKGESQSAAEQKRKMTTFLIVIQIGTCYFLEQCCLNARSGCLVGLGGEPQGGSR